ncbi:MAG: 5-formyltetrahydrofolate cyclo-ligase [Bdellovibrionaceae bacterium]|nr:5-formyltetrahydrofolate cyclo-ligase [Pseudobdellovibrionaceae bacterium]
MQTTEETVQKQAMRKAFLLKRKGVAPIYNSDFLKKENCVIGFLTQLLQSISQDNGKDFSIGAYRSLNGEVPLKGLFSTLPYPCSFPKVQDGGLHFYSADKEALHTTNLQNKKYWVKSNLGVWEPQCSKESLTPKVLLIPGVAFDKNFMRLGFGGGFYDKFLKNYKGIKIGISFSDYVLEEPLPSENHDVAMDFLVTDKCILQKVNSLKIKE